MIFSVTSFPSKSVNFCSYSFIHLIYQLVLMARHARHCARHQGCWANKWPSPYLIQLTTTLGLEQKSTDPRSKQHFHLSTLMLSLSGHSHIKQIVIPPRLWSLCSHPHWDLQQDPVSARMQLTAVTEHSPCTTLCNQWGLSVTMTGSPGIGKSSGFYIFSHLVIASRGRFLSTLYGA